MLERQTSVRLSLFEAVLAVTEMDVSGVGNAHDVRNLLWGALRIPVANLQPAGYFSA